MVYNFFEKVFRYSSVHTCAFTLSAHETYCINIHCLPEMLHLKKRTSVNELKPTLDDER